MPHTVVAFVSDCGIPPSNLNRAMVYIDLPSPAGDGDLALCPSFVTLQGRFVLYCRLSPLVL